MNNISNLEHEVQNMQRLSSKDDVLQRVQTCLEKSMALRQSYYSADVDSRASQLKLNYQIGKSDSSSLIEGSLMSSGQLQTSNSLNDNFNISKYSSPYSSKEKAILTPQSAKEKSIVNTSSSTR